jgi:hypothetical protein
MDSRLCGNDVKSSGDDEIHSGASGPANGQGILIEKTLNIRKRYQCHNISPPVPL